MATPELPIGYFDEGRAYLGSLQTLGLRPNALFWAYDRVTCDFVLVLITEVFDAVGPLELSRLLFKAYNAHVTPQAIDPFIIRLHSTDHQVAREMDKSMQFRALPGAMMSKDDEGMIRVSRAIKTVDGLDFEEDWVYVYDKPLSKKHNTTEILRLFQQFERTVNEIAA